MFSWIIESLWNIEEMDKGRVVVSCSFCEELVLGQSIAHDGACMTVTEIFTNSYAFFAMEESFLKTNFGKKKIGDVFNIERCLRVSDRLDGHIVTGHIDTTAVVSDLCVHDDASWTLVFQVDKQWYKNMVKKWSICVNGVSLTVVDCSLLDDDSSFSFSVCVIPHTLTHTNLWKLSIWDLVNLEFDYLWKYILKDNSLSC